MKYRSIAIDGPAGAGKSTLAKALARVLGFLYVDTGAIYRTVGLAALERGVDPADGVAVSELLPGLSITMGYGEDGLQHMFLDGADVTEAIRHNEVSAAASKAAAKGGKAGKLLAKAVTGASARLQGTAMLTLAGETREMEGGLTLRDGNVEVNCAFETELRVLREEMTAEVAAILFA